MMNTHLDTMLQKKNKCVDGAAMERIRGAAFISQGKYARAAAS